MKKNLFRFKHSLIFLHLATFFLLTSCNKDNKDHEMDGLGVVKVNLSNVIFEEELSNISKINMIDQSAENLFQKVELKISEGVGLKAELTRSDFNITNNEDHRFKKMATTQSQNVETGIKYRVVVYDEFGVYATQRDYIHKSEENTELLKLDGGKNYTFIVYSINSKLNNLPDIINYQNLSNATISLSEKMDFMYYRKDLKLSGSNSNNLDIVFRHKLSQITLSIDATALKSKITNVSSSFSPTFRTANVKLSDASIMRNGDNFQTEIIFPNIPAGGLEKIISEPTIINTSGLQNLNYLIKNITIGNETKTNISFPNLKILPNYKYNLKLTFTPPADKETIHEGEEVVIINDQIWMRRNLGVDKQVNPHIGSIRLHGEFYKWGRRNPVANSSVIYDSNIYNYPARNTFDRMALTKGTQDPCPNGFRIPTQAEFKKLFDSTQQTHIGQNYGNNNAYMFFQSKVNPNIKMTIPYAGLRSNGDLKLVLNGYSINLWVSDVPDYMNGDLASFGYTTSIVSNTASQHNAAMPIRCIAIR